MKRIISCLAAALLAQTVALPVIAANSDGPGLASTQTFGGTLSDPVVALPYVYVPSGRVITAWDHASTTGAQPAGAPSAAIPGVINGLVRIDDHLYASWRGTDGSGGIATYSLSDPAHPELIAIVDDYIDSEHKFPVGIAAAAGRLYLFDSNHGLFIGSLSDPDHPQFNWSGLAGGFQYKHVSANGDTLYAMGRSLLGSTVYHAYDINHPDAPVLASSFSGGGTTFFNIRSAPPFAIGVGTQTSVLDISDPHDIHLRGSLSSPSAMDAIVSGHYIYSVGFDGMDIWNFADPDQPVPAGHADITSLGTSGVATWADRGLLLTADDRLQWLDLSRPGEPTLADSDNLPGGAAVRDIALLDDHAVLLQANYGLGITAIDTLQPRARFDADLPPQLNRRDFEGFAVKGERAYLAAWAYGLVIADLSDPLHPTEIGRLPYTYANTVNIHGNLAYLTKTTNGPELAIVDISDPEHPSLRGRFSLPGRIGDLQIDGDYAYLADYSVPGPDSPPGGLRILDLTHPEQPAQVGFYSDDCTRAYDVAIDNTAQRAYVACDSGLHIIDITEPDAPRELGLFAAEKASHATVALRGDRAWFGDGEGVYEIDVSNPAAPEKVRMTPMHGYSPDHIRAVDDGRVFVLNNMAGIQVLGTREIPVPLDNRVPVAASAGDAGDSQLFSIQVPEGASALGLRSFGGHGDVTLYAAKGHVPTVNDNGHASARPGNSEMVTIARPEAGTWYVRLVGEARYDGVQVLASYQP